MNAECSKLKYHASVLHTQDIIEICTPLKQLQISTFSHVRMKNDTSFSAIVSNPAFMENYIEKQHYNADIHANPKHCHLLNCLMWDHIEAKGQTTEMLQDAAEFQFNHIFTIIKNTDTQTDLYHFGTHLKNDSFNQMYINQYDLLEQFITYFNDRVENIPHLKAAYDIEIEFEPHKNVIEYDGKLTSLTKAEKNCFLSMIQKQSNASCTPRELTLIPFILQGITAKEIGMYLGLSARTVEGYIDSLKTKLSARNKAELISKLLNMASIPVIG